MHAIMSPVLSSGMAYRVTRMQNAPTNSMYTNSRSTGVQLLHIHYNGVLRCTAIPFYGGSAYMSTSVIVR